MDIKSEIKNELNNKMQWRDPYDTEIFSSRIIRGLMKRSFYYFPELFYKTNVLKAHEWDENYILLGFASYNLDLEDELDQILKFLTSKIQWGLPVRWHSGKHIFPKGELMSTTTSEAILLLCDVKEKYNEKVDNEYLIKVGMNLLDTLNKVEHNELGYVYSYTRFDSYKVINSNLLVCAALKRLYDITNHNIFIEEYENLINVLLNVIPSKGYIPYFIDGDEKSADSYHQLFCMRALYILNENIFKKCEEYFEENFIDQYGVLFKVHQDSYDLQGLSEGIRYYGLTKNYQKFHELKDLLKNYKNNNSYTQKFSLQKNKLKKSNALYSRQGYLRLLCALSYEK